MQQYALELTLIRDARQERDRQADALKLALVSNNPKLLPVLYPEWKKASKKADQESKVYVQVEGSEADLQDTTGEWKFEDEVSAEEAQEMLAMLLDNPSGSVAASDLDQEGWV